MITVQEDANGLFKIICLSVRLSVRNKITQYSLMLLLQSFCSSALQSMIFSILVIIYFPIILPSTFHFIYLISLEFLFCFSFLEIYL